VFATGDTIVAIATPPGRGGIGVVRVSGPEAAPIGRALAGRELADRHATFAKLSNPDARGVLDHVVLTLFRAPHSYTGDDVLEISAHGSPVLLRRIVELVMSAGARLAEPGEYTLRAYLNGRIDLPQAEAVADLVEAVTPLQARAAMDQLEGTLTSAIARIDARLFDLSARLEASLDYPEEGFHFGSREQAIQELGTVRSELEALARRGRAGRVIREGRTVVIVGRPNAGKSSLFNGLAGAARAIVTSTPGTTRDLLTETVDVHGLAVTLVDTAGLRDAGDEIEAEGVRRAREAQRVAALQIVVIDGSQPLGEDDRTLLARGRETAAVIVASKSDLPRAWTDADSAGAAATGAPGAILPVSALTGAGLEELRHRIAAMLTAGEDLRDPPAITNARHLALVESALEYVAQAGEALDAGATEELVLADLTRARHALEEITGRRTTDDLLGAIFSKFCVGK
jgi:tRNA modification GTPase